MSLSLTSQIAEIDRELACRKLVYPPLIARRAMRESIAELQMAHLQAARDTLIWLQAHELTIKQRLSQ